MRPTPNTLIKKLRNNKKPFGFTLVELIVVITILVILGTIAFTSLSGFSGGARDSSRVSDLTNLSKALDIVYQKTGSYPTPDNSFTVTYSGGALWTQGTIGDTTLNFINAGGGIKMNKKPTDPLTTNKEYTYSKLFYGNAYQIKSDWEGESVAFNKESGNRDQRLVEEKEARFFSQDTFSKLLTSHFSPLTPVHAATGNPTLTYIKSNYNGIVTKTSTGTPNAIYLLAVPSLILNTNINSGTIALPTGTATGFYIHNQTNSGGISFTPKLVFSSGSLPSNDTERIIFASGIANAYSGTILATNSSIQPFITAASTNNTTALASLGGGVVSGSLGGSTNENGTTNSANNTPIPLATDASCFTFSTGAITAYSGSCTKNVVIPSTIGGVPVTTIGTRAFMGKGLTGATIPSSVTSIGGIAFTNNQITSITIPSSVTSIGASAFNNNRLTSVVIPSGVTNVGANAFNNNSQLTSVVIPSSVTSIGASAFSGITSATIYDGTISNDYIYTPNNSGVSILYYFGTSIPTTIPATLGGKPVTSIGDSVFYLKGLTSITIPSTVTSIGNIAFANNQLTSVVIPSGVTNIRASAFSNNQLSSVVIPSGVTNIEDQAFGYNQLSSITIPSSVTSIGTGAFISNKLSSVTIPSSVTSIRANTFLANQLTSVTIPSSVTSIGDGAFSYNQLTSVTIPSSVTSIGTETFKNNTLTSITIPSSVTRIGNGAFQFNTLTSVTIPSSVTSIENGVFYYNQITSVVIPSSVTSIGGRAFQNNALTSITIPSSVTSIGYAAFANNQITSVVIPSSVTSIEHQAFQYNSLTSATIASSVTSIGETAFGLQTNSEGNGVIHGPPLTGYVGTVWTNNTNFEFDKTKFTAYTADQP